jgi:ABC-type nickel/cobalt efflux system permease component RcnA
MCMSVRYTIERKDRQTGVGNLCRVKEDSTFFALTTKQSEKTPHTHSHTHFTLTYAHTHTHTHTNTQHSFFKNVCSVTQKSLTPRFFAMQRSMELHRTLKPESENLKSSQN